MQKRSVFILWLLTLFLGLVSSKTWAFRLDISSSTLVYPTQTIEPTGDDLSREYPLFEYLMVNAKITKDFYFKSYSLLDINYSAKRTDVSGNAFYAFAEYNNFLGALDFQIGRQFMLTGVGFSLFDGAILNLHPIQGLSIKPYFGIPVNEDFSQEKLNEALKAEQIYGASANYNINKMNFGLEYREQVKKNDAGSKEVVQRLAGFNYNVQASRDFSLLASAILDMLPPEGGAKPQDMHFSTDWRMLSRLRWVNSLEFYRPFIPNTSFMLNLFSPLTKEHITLNLEERYQVKETFVLTLGHGFALNASGGYNIFKPTGEGDQEYGYIAGVGISSRKVANTTFELQGNMEKDPEYKQNDVTLKISKHLYSKYARLGINLAGGLALYDTKGEQQKGQFAYLEGVIGLTQKFDLYLLTEYYSNPIYNYDVRFLLKVNINLSISFFE